MSYLAKANLALSITLTAVSTLLAPLFTPILMKLLAGEFIDIDVLKMMWVIVKMVIFPIGAGLVFNKLLKGKAKWLDVAYATGIHVWNSNDHRNHHCRRSG